MSRKKITVKEVTSWLKTLEENRYKKICKADARRVTYFCNFGESKDQSHMGLPGYLKKNWKNAVYEHERRLAGKYLRKIAEKKKAKENRLRQELQLKEILKKIISKRG